MYASLELGVPPHPPQPVRPSPHRYTQITQYETKLRLSLFLCIIHDWSICDTSHARGTPNHVLLSLRYFISARCARRIVLAGTSDKVSPELRHLFLHDLKQHWASAAGAAANSCSSAAAIAAPGKQKGHSQARLLASALLSMLRFSWYSQRCRTHFTLV